MGIGWRLGQLAGVGAAEIRSGPRLAHSVASPRTRRGASRNRMEPGPPQPCPFPKLGEGIPDAEAAYGAAKQHRFSPYVNNGGTALAIAGDDYCVVAADTRLSLGFAIQSRNTSKCATLTDRAVLASSGMQADADTLHRYLRVRMEQYRHQHQKSMSAPAIAQMLANTLYQRRFFPYYTFNVLGGLDENGKGCVFTYDAIGSYERVQFSCSGTGTALIQPLLDNQIGHKNQTIGEAPKLSAAECVDLVKDTFSSAGERDIYTGDFVEIYTITANGVTTEQFQLKFD